LFHGLFSLEKWLHNTVSQLLVSLVSSYRYDKVAVNLEVAKSEASKLHEAINNKKLDDDHIVWTLSTRNLFQLRETFACYKNLYGNTLEQVLLSNFRFLYKILIFVTWNKNFFLTLSENISYLPQWCDSILVINSLENLTDSGLLYCIHKGFGLFSWQGIKSCGNGDLETLLQLVILCIDSPEKHFAKVNPNFFSLTY